MLWRAFGGGGSFNFCRRQEGDQRPHNRQALSIAARRPNADNVFPSDSVDMSEVPMRETRRLFEISTELSTQPTIVTIWQEQTLTRGRHETNQKSQDKLMTSRSRDKIRAQACRRQRIDLELVTTNIHRAVESVAWSRATHLTFRRPHPSRPIEI